MIGAVIYTIIYNYIFLDYMGFIQENLSKHNNNFEDTKFKDFSGLKIPDILINIIIVMDLLNIKYRHLY